MLPPAMTRREPRRRRRLSARARAARRAACAADGLLPRRRLASCECPSQPGRAAAGSRRRSPRRRRCTRRRSRSLHRRAKFGAALRARVAGRRRGGPGSCAGRFRWRSDRDEPLTVGSADVEHATVRSDAFSHARNATSSFDERCVARNGIRHRERDELRRRVNAYTQGAPGACRTTLLNDSCVTRYSVRPRVGDSAAKSP